jgi:hypothetical protein
MPWTTARELNAEVVPSSYSLSSAATFDVAADGRVLALDDVPDSFELVLVRNGLSQLAKATSK